MIAARCGQLGKVRVEHRSIEPESEETGAKDQTRNRFEFARRRAGLARERLLAGQGPGATGGAVYEADRSDTQAIGFIHVYFGAAGPVYDARSSGAG